MDTPVDKVKLFELPKRYGPLAFLFPTQERPTFGNDQEAVTRDAADKLATCFNKLVRRKDVNRATAQRFVLQMLVTPWRELIENADTATRLNGLLDRMRQYRVLGPACGSGNSLYVAYRELKRLEARAYERIASVSRRRVAGQRAFGFIGCSRVTRRPVMVFLSTEICPSDLVQVFALDDDYSFGVLQQSASESGCSGRPGASTRIGQSFCKRPFSRLRGWQFALGKPRLGR